MFQKHERHQYRTPKVDAKMPLTALVAHVPPMISGGPIQSKSESCTQARVCSNELNRKEGTGTKSSRHKEQTRATTDAHERGSPSNRMMNARTARVGAEWQLWCAEH